MILQINISILVWHVHYVVHLVECACVVRSIIRCIEWIAWKSYKQPKKRHQQQQQFANAVFLTIYIFEEPKQGKKKTRPYRMLGSRRQTTQPCIQTIAGNVRSDIGHYWVICVSLCSTAFSSQTSVIPSGFYFPLFLSPLMMNHACMYRCRRYHRCCC